MLGYTNTELVVTGSTAASGDTSSQAADLPANGTVLDAFNLGNGYENVYTATPDVGSTSGTVTDTLVTPYGDTNLDSLFGSINAARPLDPGAAFTGLEGGDSSIGADAFSIGDTTFDPVLTNQVTFLPSGGEGFDPVYQTIGAPPLLNLGGGMLDYRTAPSAGAAGLQRLRRHRSHRHRGRQRHHLRECDQPVGLDQHGVHRGTVTAASGADPTDLPSVGSVYDVFNLGDGIENVYTAIAGAQGSPTPSPTRW